MHIKSPAVPFALLIFSSMLWGASFPLTKIMAGAFPPVALAALRGAVGAASLIVWFILLKERFLPQDRRETLDWVILGALNGWIPNLLLAFAVQTLPSGQAAMIQACGPLITALMAARLFADERLSARKLFGIGLGFGGVALLIGPRLFGTGGTPSAVLAMLGIAFCYASGNIFVRLMPVADPKRLALGQQVMSALFAGSMAMALVGPMGFAALPANILPVLALGIVSTALPIAIFMVVLRAIGPTKASLTGYMVPAWAVMLSAITLGESIGLREMIAGIVILAGVYVVTTARSR